MILMARNLGRWPRLSDFAPSALGSVLQRLRIPSRLICWPEENHWISKGEDSRYWYQEVYARLKSIWANQRGRQPISETDQLVVFASNSTNQRENRLNTKCLLVSFPMLNFVLHFPRPLDLVVCIQSGLFERS
jgi:hypothetical protein